MKFDIVVFCTGVSTIKQNPRIFTFSFLSFHSTNEFFCALEQLLIEKLRKENIECLDEIKLSLTEIEMMVVCVCVCALFVMWWN